MSHAALIAQLHSNLAPLPGQEHAMSNSPPDQSSTAVEQPRASFDLRYEPEPVIARLVRVEQDYHAIKLHDDFGKFQCQKYWESGWRLLSEALPSPLERAMIDRMRAFIQRMWPLVDPNDFAIKLRKFVQCEEDDSDDDLELAKLSASRFCQAILGVSDTDDDGDATYSVILIGAKVMHEVHEGKKPEFELERRAMARMLSTANLAMGQMSPVSRKRMAESTYEGSTTPTKKSKMDHGGSSPIEIL